MTRGSAYMEKPEGVAVADETERLAPALVERVLEKLKLSIQPAPTLAGLRTLYAAWCCNVPFDNVRKLIHLQRKDAAPLPGDQPADFFEAWLRYGTGGTCWAGNGALHALLVSLGFTSARGLATMLVTANLPPNHGTVAVDCEGKRYLVDASILHGEPLELAESGHAAVSHPSWGVQFDVRAGQKIVRWRPLHRPEGFDCRIDQLGASAETFGTFHEKSRPWSLFNYQLYGRLNRGGTVIGTAFGQRIEFDAAGTLLQRGLDGQARLRFVVEELGIKEEIAVLLPADVPTPPPPSPPEA